MHVVCTAQIARFTGETLKYLRNVESYITTSREPVGYCDISFWLRSCMMCGLSAIGLTAGESFEPVVCELPGQGWHLFYDAESAAESQCRSIARGLAEYVLEIYIWEYWMPCPTCPFSLPEIRGLTARKVEAVLFGDEKNENVVAEDTRSYSSE
jgi:hypothetical protein